ncbi:MAG TPA: pitrilysin family protein [Burkholderiales bacterium]|nr:pitrilysin family protein [Burkholderiales bacterium]
MLVKLASLALLLVGLAPAVAAPAGPAAAARVATPQSRIAQAPSEVVSIEGVTEYRLANGLKLLLVPDPSIDTITVHITYLVGSRNEGYGEAGMAHLLEHMLFRGTPRYPNVKGEFLKHGARFNGTTSYDRTNYFETFTADDKNLEWALDIEADRMRNARVSRKDLDAEMTVVRNEFESGENSPYAVLRERVASAAYVWHNYGRAIIGARSDIENVPIERLQAFYREFYQPDNAVLIVSGRFDQSTALRLVQKHFGPLPRPTRALRKTYTVEPTQDGERTVTLRRVGDAPLVSVLYHLPPGTHADYAAVDVLVAMLNHVPSGRLHKALVETGKASYVFGSERQQREAGYGYFGAGLPPGGSLDEARDVLLATLEDVGRNRPSDEEVERARTRLLNDFELTIADSRQLTGTLSEYAAIGDWRMLYLHRDRLRKVTADDVQRVAAHYLKASNRTVGLFIPTKELDRADIPAVPDVAAALKDYKGSGMVAQGEAFDPTPANIEARTIRRTLPGGLKLALLPKRTRGHTVVAQISLRWGTQQSKAGRSAACGAASAMLVRGTQKKTREQIRNEFDRLKANVGIGAEGGSIETVRASLPDVLRQVAEVLREPSFPESEFEQFRRAAITSIDTQRSDPGALAGIAISRHLNPYPPGHWLYNMTLEERAEKLKDLSLEDVKRCYTDLVGASNGEVAVVGDFDPDEVSRLLGQLLGDWKSPSPYSRIAHPFQDVSAINEAILTPDKANAVYRAGMNLKIRDDSPDFPALLLGNYLLGGGSDSRLLRRVREQEGLSYSVGSYVSADSLDQRGAFGVYAIYAPQNRARVEALIMEELRKALDQGFGAEEVENAKRGLLQARKVARTQDDALASRLASYLFVGRTFDWDAQLERRVAALTPAEVQAALRRYLDPAKLSVVKAGDFPKVAGADQPAPAN